MKGCVNHGASNYMTEMYKGIQIGIDMYGQFLRSNLGRLVIIGN